MSPLISVIIPAHNEEHYLPETLQYLARQTYRHFEVIVVANGCSDATEEIAKARCDRFIWLDERNLGCARNVGGKKARGELLVFLDADTLIEPHALESIASEFTRDHAMGTLKGLPDTTRLSHRAVYWLKNFLHYSHVHYGSSGVIIGWKDHFRAVGGFDDGLQVREISDFMNKMRRFGKYKYISSTAAITSMRRFKRFGTPRMAWLWVKIWVSSWISDLRHRHYEVVR
jgi:glycosyltransferase involved in cell wall biosynthesis